MSYQLLDSLTNFSITSRVLYLLWMTMQRLFNLKLHVYLIKFTETFQYNRFLFIYSESYSE